jgi:hypothetical protein
MEGVLDLEKVRLLGVSKLPTNTTWANLLSNSSFEDSSGVGGAIKFVAILRHVDDERGEALDTEEKLENIKRGPIWRLTEIIGVPETSFDECLVQETRSPERPADLRGLTVADVAERGIDVAKVWAKGARVRLFDSIDEFSPPLDGQAYVAVVENDGVYTALNVSDRDNYAAAHQGNSEGRHRVDHMRIVFTDDLLACCRPAKPTPRSTPDAPAP